MRRLSVLVRGASARGARARARKLVAMAGIATVIGSGAVVATAASASAHTGNASATCEALTVDLTNFQPIVPARDAVTHEEFLFEHAANGKYKTRWEKSADWNAESNPNSTGWSLVQPAQTRTVTDQAAAPAQSNHVTVVINGGTKLSKDFGTSFSQTFTFNNPYRAKGNTWSVSWTAYDDARFSGSVSGTASPCERPEQPAPLVEHRDVTGQPDCESLTVTTEHQSRTQVISWDYDRWNAVWGDWVTDSVTTDAVEPGECGPGDNPGPTKKYTPWKDQAWACGDTTTTQTRTKTVTTYTLVDGTWVADTPVVTTQTRTRDLTADEITECPVEHNPYTTNGHDDTVDCQSNVVDVASWTTRWTWDDQAGAYVGATTTSHSQRTPTAAECPAGERPQPIVSSTDSSDVDCTSKVRTVTTTTTTTDWALNDAKTEWVKTTPVVSTKVATYETTAQECPTPTTPPTVGGVKHTAPPTIVPTVKGVKHSAAAPALAYTGSQAEGYGLAGLTLLVVGSALVLVTRRRTTRG